MDSGKWIVTSLLALALGACGTIGDPQVGGDCAPSEFACESGGCVPRSQLCNGRDNCDDGSDEFNCLDRCEHRSDYRCKDGDTCVTAEQVCDGRPDCPGADDEATCATPTCDGFQCQDGSCIDAEQKCDGKADCLLAEDEAPEMCAPTRCGNTDFRCADGATCLKADQVCDGTQQCPGGDDETGDLCANAAPDEQPKGPDRPGTPGKPSDNKPDEGRPCISIDEKGLCDGNILVWCDGGQVERKSCTRDNNKVCQKVSDDDGYACVEGPDSSTDGDSCPGVSDDGYCEGDTLVFCSRGEVRRQDCTKQRPGKSCVEDDGKPHCAVVATTEQPDPCDGIPEGGLCDGDKILVSCKNGQPQRYDCSAGGMVCSGDPGAASCEARGCGDIDYQGVCDGTTLQYCYQNTLETVECGDYGLGCGLQDEDVGNNCVFTSESNECGDLTYEGECSDDATVRWCEDGSVYHYSCGEGKVCGDITLDSGEVVKGCVADEPPAPSCAGMCGSSDAVPGSSPACYCDDFCETNGDCCDDHADVCPVLI